MSDHAEPRSDTALRAHIELLMHEEDALYGKEGGLSPADRARLDELKVHLDQVWDLLRQRQARREFGENPDDATLRSPEVVESYIE